MTADQRWMSEKMDRHGNWTRWTVGTLEDCLEDAVEAKWHGAPIRITYNPEGHVR